MSAASPVLGPDDSLPVTVTVESALAAFSSNPGYAIKMANVANQILHERVVWRFRLELRAAEKLAKAQCAGAEPFECHSKSPCGVGPGCRFATGDLALLEVPACPGKTIRPQEQSEGTYNLEHAVLPYMEQQQGSRTS